MALDEPLINTTCSYQLIWPREHNFETTTVE